VTVISRNDIWAVGGASPDSHLHCLSEHWDGAKWSIVASPDPPNPKGGSDPFLVSISAVAADSIWAVGNHDSRSPGAFAEHWNRKKWVVGRVAVPKAVLRGITAIGGHLWAVGQSDSNAHAEYR
jgi:hypothetical protein